MSVREPLPEWPLFGLADDVRPTLSQVREAGQACTLATLIAVEGGGPRPVGTQMVFAPGVTAGYFSGGCVESDVADHAFACLADGEPRTLVYGEGSPWPDIQLLCGARIEIFLERVAPDDAALAELLAAQAERRPVVWVSDGFARECAAEVSPWPEAAVVRRHEPTPRLIVVGGDLPSTAGYVGLLGARRRIPDRLAPLRAEGAPEGAFARLHAPIGLDIGGKAPWEVAVSVIGEIMALRYARDSGATSTTVPAAAAAAPAGRRSSASETAKTLTSEES